MTEIKSVLSRLISLKIQTVWPNYNVINWEPVELPSINSKVASAEDLEYFLSQNFERALALFLIAIAEIHA